MHKIAFIRQILTAEMAAGMGFAAWVALMPAAARPASLCDVITKAALEEALKAILGPAVDPALAASDSIQEYLTNPDDKKLDAAMNTLANGGLAIACPACGTAMIGGALVVGGVEKTIEEIKSLKLQAFLCGTTSWGVLQMEGFFQTNGAQAIAKGINCENFAERITNFDDFTRLKKFFEGDYSRNVHELGGEQNRGDNQRILDEAWQTIEAKLGVKIAEKLRAAFIREAEALKAREACKPAAKGSVPGEDITDPALEPEPPTPPGGHYVLTKTDLVTDVPFTDTEITASPQKISFKAPYGEMVCAWSTPPKSVSGEFDFSLQVSSTPAKGQNLQAHIVARSGFTFISGTPDKISGTSNEAYANGANGIGETGYAKMRLGPGDMKFATPGQLLYFEVGGCGGHVTYTYEFIG
jgi:hypothetical protein